MGKREVIIGIILAFLSYAWFLRTVFTNAIPFETDEMYWISTSDSLFRIVKGDFANPKWRENFGFANLNGSKILYGTALLTIGVRNVDRLGTGAETYYLWERFAGKPFPAAHEFYPLLTFARAYSAVFAALGVLLTYLTVIRLTRSKTAGALASIVMALHPVTVHIASHALADGMFLFFQMATLYLLVRQGSAKKASLRLDIATGCAFAWLVSVKMNGLLFFPILLLLAIPWRGLSDWQEANTFAGRIIVIGISGIATFLLLHPNFFFYPSYSLIDIYRDRVWITINHIGYFSVNYSEHVTLGLPSRLTSLVRHVFTPMMTITSGMAFLVLLYAAIRKKILRQHLTWMCVILMAATVILAYTTFDEKRYYYPLVPLLSVMVGIGFSLVVRPTRTS